jgi:hypothetical protein
MAVQWWPAKAAVRTGPNMGGRVLIGDVWAWWQWRQRLRTSSVRNMHRFYLRPMVFGRLPKSPN